MAVMALVAACAIRRCSELAERHFRRANRRSGTSSSIGRAVGAGVAISYYSHQIKERRSLTVKTAGDRRARKAFFVNFLLALTVPIVLSLIATALLVCQTGRESGRSVCLVPSEECPLLARD
jgi:hypothetical protein